MSWCPPYGLILIRSLHLSHCPVFGVHLYVNGFADCVDAPACTGVSCGGSTIEGEWVDPENPSIDPITYYCSKGVDEFLNVLPAFVADMHADGYMTRHCCREGEYWLPDNDNPELSACTPSQPCFELLPLGNPDPNLHCQFNHTSQFSEWSTNISATPPNPQGCVEYLDNSWQGCCVQTNVFAQTAYYFQNVQYCKYGETC